MKYTDILKQIEPSILDKVIGICKDIESLYSQKELLAQNIITSTAELTKLNEEHKLVIQQTKDISKARRDAEDIITRANIRSIELAEEEEFSQSNLKRLLERKEKLHADINELQKTNDNLISIKDELDRTKKLVRGANEELVKAQELITRAEQDRVAKLHEIEKLHIDYENEVRLDKEKVAQDKSFIQERYAEISKRDQTITQKENDLATVEARWYKLFKEKGLSFKV